MRRDKVERERCCFCKLDELWNPIDLTRGRTAHSQAFVYRFDGENSDLVQVEVLFFGSSPKAAIWLVPDLVVPLLYLGQAIAGNVMRYKGGNEIRKLLPVGGRRRYAIIVKYGFVRARGQRTRHEAELNYRPHTQAENIVQDGIGVEKRVAAAIVAHH